MTRSWSNGGDDDQLWQLLRSLDDPDHFKHPPGYDHHRGRARFNQVAQRLDTEFGCRCDVDRNVQDASLHGRIEVPATSTATGHPLVVLISNFGGLAVLAVDNPGAWTDAEADALLHSDDAHRVRAALGDLGYTLVPEEDLWRPYDGVWGPRISGPSPATWWDRYFDYL